MKYNIWLHIRETASQSKILTFTNLDSYDSKVFESNKFEKKRNSFKDTGSFANNKDFEKMNGFVNGMSSKTSGASYDHSQDEKWEKVNLIEKNTGIYIKYFEATDINIDVSFIARFSNDIRFTNDQKQQNQNLFASIGLALSTIENAPIKIRKMQLRNVAGFQNDIHYLFSEYYSNSLKKNFVLIIGSTGILGNPVGVVKALQSGVHDFVHQPIDGFRVSAAKGGIGVLKGTGSLVKNTAEGVFGWFSKITSSVSKGKPQLIFYD